LNGVQARKDIPIRRREINMQPVRDYISDDLVWQTGRRTVMRRMVYATFAIMACALAGNAVVAQSYPARPIRIIVPVAAGSTIDLVPRLLAPGMSEALGQSVYIENRPGASGKIGTVAAVQAPADGYTIATMTAGTHGTLPGIMSDPGYDPINGLAPIVLVTATPLGFFVNAKVPVKSVAELADYIRANPGKLNYSTAGIGTGHHINAAIFLSQAGLPQSAAVHIPYRGEVPAVTALINGDAQFMITNIGREFVDRGDLRVLATTGQTRWFRFPDVPTTAEIGYPGVQYTGWIGFGAPAGTPQAVIDRINQAANHALQDPKVQKVLTETGIVSRGGPPAELAGHVNSEVTRWKKLIKESGAKFD
jgi:tripartite-type tricarboxylate transporter receptor subunit TctC